MSDENTKPLGYTSLLSVTDKTEKNLSDKSTKPSDRLSHLTVTVKTQKKFCFAFSDWKFGLDLARKVWKWIKIVAFI